MRKLNLAAALVCCILFSSCGMLSGGTSTAPAASQSGSGSLLGGLLGGGSTSGDGGLGLLGSIVGSLTQSTTEKTIVGNWTYVEPTVQFESDNFLAQAGGAVATNTIVSKIKPYYEKFGIKQGVMKMQLTADHKCTIQLSGKTISGTYVFDQAKSTLTIKGSTGMTLMSAYVSVSLNQLALTFDSTKLMTLTQTLGANSTNASISSLTGLLGNYKGMKTGFLFKK